MNDFFCSIGKYLAGKIAPAQIPFFQVNMKLTSITPHAASRLLKYMKSGKHFAMAKTAKSFGTDNISSYFLKLALPFIENSLAMLFNISIGTSRFPDSQKVARVTPILKDGDKTDSSNYRPILVLPVISRL